MRGEFTITIRIGNEAMQTDEDVYRALVLLAEKMDLAGDPRVFRQAQSVFDENGQRVGQAKFTEEEE